MATELRLVLEDKRAVEREYDVNLRHGRALVPVCVDVERGTPLLLVVERAEDGATLTMEGRVAVVLEHGTVRGTAIELDLAANDARARLERFVAGERADEPASEELLVGGALPTLDFAPLPSPEPREDEHDAHDDDVDDATRNVDPKVVRIRKLTLSERTRLARDGQLEDRVLLERLHGKTIWEDLLRNPAISVPEVARIANKGTAPRHLLELIVDNQAWSRQSIVRRALLANPRIGNDAVTKLLRATPKPELKMMTQGTAYPLAVRGLAKKLLDE